MIRGAFVLELLGAGERARGSWIFLGLGDWSAWVRRWALGRLGSASIARTLTFINSLGVLGDGTAKALDGFVGLETAWLKLFLRT